MPIIELSKFDVAERQLLQAINMFFNGEDSVSIHTLSEAASQVLYDIGGKDWSTVRDNDYIKEEKKEIWLQYLFKSRNFFKHADRDKNKTHEFNSELNNFSLLEAANMYTHLKKKWVPESLMFHAWFAIEYPELIREGTEVHKLYVSGENGGFLPDPKNKTLMYEFIQNMRNGINVIPNVSLEYGL